MTIPWPWPVRSFNSLQVTQPIDRRVDDVLDDGWLRFDSADSTWKTVDIDHTSTYYSQLFKLLLQPDSEVLFLQEGIELKRIQKDLDITFVKVNREAWKLRIRKRILLLFCGKTTWSSVWVTPVDWPIQLTRVN